MDQENDADMLAMVGASAALEISDIPFAGPIASVRVGRLDGQFVANPTLSQMVESDINIIIAGSRTGVVMVEGGGDVVREADMLEAIFFGHKAIQPIIDIQEQLREAVGKTKITPFLEAGTGSVLDFASAVDAGDEFVVVDVETTGTDPKMADLVEIADRKSVV